LAGRIEGIAFKLNRPASAGGSWTESVLWNFGGVGDGLEPLADLVTDARGDLFGTTELGGALSNSTGTVFGAPIER